MYKVFINKLSIILTSKNKSLSQENSFLLSSITLNEILKKVRKHKKIFLYHPKKSELLKVFKSKIKVIFASGGIVKNDNNQILFIYRRGKWDLPKGKAEKGESIRETAVREVIEETGVEKLKIDKYFSNTFHIVRNNKKYFLKETSWFLMSSNFKGKLKPQLNEGIKSVKWKTFDDAKKIKKKTYGNISIILTDFLKQN
ncbi:MAG: NUDIX hydrolase [Flavobacteriales bacterium]|jgi:8-oxo-dGTP pyrophosphatase MutT (NUDIX family)|nr:NUDIX hydrolase [Flavobacteriales bacterium]|tara:strand:+ start:82 stop:678 length:597 start_codon:yes stop_codon:yes gene_type:complete